jgi:alpha-galactosidase
MLGGALLLLAALPSAAGASPTGGAGPTAPRPALTPPMGWDSWDSFGCGVTERDVEQAANWLVATGMRDAGYRYVIIDDCWYAPTRRADGSLRPNTSKFPTGMRWLGWYLHARGLLFGIYESASQSTCAQLNGLYPGVTGSLGHERQDAQTFASWGVDYVKYDWCSPDGSAWDQIAAFERMRDALRAARRPVVYSINPNSFHTTTGNHAHADWSAVANLVRTGPDLAPAWDMGPLQNWYTGVLNAIAIDAPLWRRAGPGHWNDPDALVVGMHAAGYAGAVDSPSLSALINSPPAGVYTGLSYEDMRTNFAMWAMLAAPLIVGDDPRYLGPAVRSILLNHWLIGIDQDPLGIQARPVRPDHEVWAKPLSDRSVALALFNPSNIATTITATVPKLGLPAAQKYAVRDLWTGTDSTTNGSLRANVPAHGAAVFRVAPIAKPRPTSKRRTHH